MTLPSVLWHTRCSHRLQERDGVSVASKHLPARLFHLHTGVDERAGAKAECAMTKYLMMLMMLLSVAAVNVGCEADADVDDDGAKLKVDTD